MSIIKDKSKTDVYAFLGYSVLTAIFTYPLIFKMRYIAGNDPDVYPYLWVLWWVKKAILELHTTPNFSRYIFYPNGADLSFHALTFFHSYITIPLQSIFGTIVSYNILILFSFVVTGFGVYLLVNYLTQNRKAAFISGVIFMFAPYRFAHALGHFTYLSTEWIPFFCLYLIKTVEEKPLRNSIMAAIFLVLLTLSTWYYMFFMFIFTFVYLVYEAIINRERIINYEFVKRLGIGLLAFAILISPFVYPLVKTTAKESYMVKPIDSTFILSADIVAFFIPAQFHPIFGKYVSSIYSRFTGNPLENNLFLGYSVLILSLYAVKKIKRKEVKFWAISAVVFFVLALGPALHILGRFMFSSPIPLGGVGRVLGITPSPLGQELMNRFFGIPLPYLFLYLFVPFFSISRTPGRFGVMTIFSLAILAGYAITKILGDLEGQKWHGIKKEQIFASGILLIILFEFLAIPFPMTSPVVPEFYHQISKDKEDYAVVEVPLEPIGEHMYYATIHNKRILWAYIARVPPDAKEFVEDIPLLKKFQCLAKVKSSIHGGIMAVVESSNPEASSILQKYIESGKDIYSYADDSCEDLEITKNDVETLRNFKIKYIIVHKSNDQSTYDELLGIFNEILEDPSAHYEDEQMIVFKVY